MELILIDVGRNKVNKTIHIKNEKGIIKELEKHLMSRSIELVETAELNKYDVFVGMFRNVGQIIVR